MIKDGPIHLDIYEDQRFVVVLERHISLAASQNISMYSPVFSELFLFLKLTLKLT